MIIVAVCSNERVPRPTNLLETMKMNIMQTQIVWSVQTLVSDLVCCCCFCVLWCLSIGCGDRLSSIIYACVHYTLD